MKFLEKGKDYIYCKETPNQTYELKIPNHSYKLGEIIYIDYISARGDHIGMYGMIYRIDNDLVYVG